MESNSINGRMGLAARKFFIEQKRTLLIFIGGYLGMCLVLGLWGGLMGATPGEEAVASIYVLFAGLVCAIVASKTFFDMTNKEGRISLLMSPATALDKYIPRLITVVPGMVILTVIGYFVTSYATMLYDWFITDQWLPLRNVFKGDSALLIYTFISLFLFNEAMFVFGSIAWPKKSFLKTVGIFIALQTILTTCSVIYVKSGTYITISNEKAFAWTLSSLILAAALGLFYGAYRKLQKSTVI